jgi:hypothetical protein
LLHKETVEKPTLELLIKLMNDNSLKEFVLVGGTALALQLGHRISIDLALFSISAFDSIDLGNYLRINYNFELDFIALNTLKGEIEGIQLDFITHQYPWVQTQNIIENIRLASFTDIAAMKLNAISGNGTILSKISDNTEVVGIIGLGYVGLPLAVNFAEAGVKVIGFDKSESKVNKINSGENYIKDIRDAVLREVVDRVKLEATTDFTRMCECDALIICVPTPLDKFRKPDMSYIEASCIAIGQNMKPGTFISLESTTYPPPPKISCSPSSLKNHKPQS